jgi:hypothetical protein
MAREPRNIGASVRARLLDRARTAKTDFQILLTRYALARLLYPYGKNSEPGLLFCDVRSKIRLLWLLSALSIFHRLPPTR